jgi:hypothetical protein
LRLPLVRRSNGLILALVAASFGLFLFGVGLAEHPTERRYIMELTLICPILLYALTRLGKGSSTPRRARCWAGSGTVPLFSKSTFDQ